MDLHSDQKKKKKKQRKEKKEKRKKKRHSSSSSSSEEDWVEKLEDNKKENSLLSGQAEHDEWMGVSNLFSGSTRNELRTNIKVKEVKTLDLPGQNERELNPYWKNGGTGLPSNFGKSSSYHLKNIHCDNLDKSKKSDYHKKSAFLRPSEGSDIYNRVSTSEGTRKNDLDRLERNSVSKSGWRKQDHGSANRCDETIEVNEGEHPKTLCDAMKSGDEEGSSKDHVMTRDELNYLAAKALKAEITGNMELAASLQKELEKERNKRQVVILTRTDKKGFIRPVKYYEHGDSGYKSKYKVETHSDGKRVRYFADDDKYSLSNIFEREKLGLSANIDEEFARLAKKNIGPDGSTRDMDDVFEETARKNDGNENRERKNAIREYHQKEKALDSCRWCLDTQEARHNIVSIGKEVYLCVPPYQSLTEGHCLIIPNHHVPCATLLDENIWNEITDIKKSLVQFYKSRDEDVVFFEIVSNLKNHPHMVINSVPIPKEVGDTAPIYFKKAIQECEMEWSSNKKLVELAGKGVRRAIPKGLPYFSVDFGLQDGFAHIIEDYKLFPNNFAQEIIGGMLDLDHSLWRKPRRENSELQRKKASEFNESFKKYNPMKEQ